ncbi:MAG TPA: hypothetical protein VIV11_08140 [Kofleriaceae bacterium]
MPLDLEDELLRAAHALCERDRVNAFTAAALLDFVRATGPPIQYPRLSHQLLAHLVDALASSLVQSGHLAQVGGPAYALTALALEHLVCEPAYLRDEILAPRECQAAEIQEAGDTVGAVKRVSITSRSNDA